MYLKYTTYWYISKKILVKHKLPINDDNISFVASYLMRADQIYDKDRNDLTRSDLRGVYSRYARLTIKSNMYSKYKKGKRKTIYSLDYAFNNRKSSSFKMANCLEDEKIRQPIDVVSESEMLDKIRDSIVLTKHEKLALLEHLTTNKPINIIGEEIGVKGNHIYVCIKNAAKKMSFLLKDR